MVYCSQTPDLAYMWARIGFVSVSFIPFTNLYFNMTLTENANKRSEFLIFSFILTVFFASISQTKLIYAGITEYFWGYYPLAGTFYALFIAFYVSVWLYSLILLFRYMQRNKELKNFPTYHKAKYVLIAWSGGLLGIVDFLPKYGLPIYPFAYLVGVYWILVSAYSILPDKSRMHMFIFSRRALIASGVLGILIAAYSVVYSLIRMWGHFSISVGTLSTAAFVSMIGGIILYPLYRKTRDFIDQTFFQEFHHRHERMAELSQGLLVSKNPTEFSEKIVHAAYDAFKAIRASFFLLNGEQSAYVLQAELNWGSPTKSTAEIAIPLANSLAKSLQTQDSLSSGDSNTDEASKILSAFGARLAIPIKSEEDKLLGFLLLGEKESGLQYTEQDIHDLKSFATLTAVVARTEQLLWQQVELQNLVEERTRDLIAAQENLVATERLAAIGEMASIISHEIRTPLAVIGQALYLLENRMPAASKNEQVQKQIDIMNAQVRSANSILSEILEYVRERPLMLEKGNVNRLIYDLTSAMPDSPSNVQFILNLSKDIPEILFDQQEITQAFNNVTKNALESMPNGGKLSIDTSISGDDIEIRFSDTGCGISEADLEKIYEPLFTTKKGGTGLGMAVVKKAIHHHNGRIEIQSKVGQGTTVIIKIPSRTYNVKVKI